MNKQETMRREKVIWWVNHLFEIRKEEYFNKGMMEDAKEVEQAQHMAIEALSDPHDCAGCKYEEMWSEACEKCGRPMVDNYVKESEE